ncbi:hypothetical protein [Amphritea balenae]|uniref:Adhesin n=1 Tax=Amphritea balenae TaxID=452629 RepID=A0A3P1SI44_9GAMM|nr:hypothetical protein [Amphritea balenae]RRC96684.1 hypothetical protein EHS89_20670 [Amphritea balenae]GGK84522.1 hypothetical protein GCM10007941_38790 [Amphritea balenae]
MSTLCTRLSIGLLFLSAATHIAAEAPQAADRLGYSAQAVISDFVLEGSRGIIGVNIVAGDSNAQLNARALAVSIGQGLGATARIKASQHVGLSGGEVDSAVSLIEGNAFSNASGLISINHASGSGNAQLNDITIGFALGGIAVSESELSLTVTGQPVSQIATSDAIQHREVGIGEGAFSGASGVVQINQLAGSGNVTNNSFGLSVSLGAEE